MDTATLIAEKSPVAVSTTKMSMVYSRDHTVREGLDHIAAWNGVGLQTEDMGMAVGAFMTKSKATFSKL